MKHRLRLAADAIVLCTTVTAMPLLAQQPTPPAQTTFTGCAMPLADDPTFLTLCEKDSCELLRGKVDLKWAHHTITLRGKLTLPDGVQPRTIEVTGLVKLGEACNKTCVPSMTGRGLGDTPGSKDLGTPGKNATPPRP